MTQTATTTTAQTISALLSDDGQCWDTDDGVNFDDLCEAQGGRNEYREGHRGGSYRYAFHDGSALTVHGDGWDHGYSDCWCWAGAGHTDGCEAAQASTS